MAKLTAAEELERQERLWEPEREWIDKGYALVAGVDEAGRGPLAGPVYAAAVILPQGAVIDGINDSKKLTEKKREELYGVITSVALDYCIASVDEKTIDDINILNATFLAMNNAVNGLGHRPDFVLIDGNCIRGMELPHETLVKGDARSISIAAASVLAKVARDRYITEIGRRYPEYGFEKHKGYGTKAHYEALQKYGPSPVHRRTFLKKLGKHHGDEKNW